MKRGRMLALAIAGGMTLASVGAHAGWVSLWRGGKLLNFHQTRGPTYVYVRLPGKKLSKCPHIDVEVYKKGKKHLLADVCR